LNIYLNFSVLIKIRMDENVFGSKLKDLIDKKRAELSLLKEKRRKKSGSGADTEAAASGADTEAAAENEHHEKKI
jgi:uncharacterized membrane protein YukC